MMSGKAVPSWAFVKCVEEGENLRGSLEENGAQ
jgi:hypothetical protein